MIHSNDSRFLRSAFAVTALVLSASLIASVCFNAPMLRVQLVGTARRPLVLVGGQTEQLPTADYLSSPGGMTVNATAPITAGDFEATTFNGMPLTGAGGGSVSVSSSTSTASAGWKSVNATTEGTIDWAEPSGAARAPAGSCVSGPPTKTAGGNQLTCVHGGIYPWFGGNNITGEVFGSCGAGCTVYFTWTASDTTASNVVSVGTSAYYDGYHVNGTPTPTPFGWVYNAPARTTQLVLRQYLAVINMSTVTCTGTLSDGSGAASTTPFNSGTGVLMYYAPVWTYHAATPGAYLVVQCFATGNAPTGGDSYTYWLGETLSTI